ARPDRTGEAGHPGAPGRRHSRAHPQASRRIRRLLHDQDPVGAPERTADTLRGHDRGACGPGLAGGDVRPPRRIPEAIVQVLGDPPGAGGHGSLHNGRRRAHPRPGRPYPSTRLLHEGHA
ncbi:unnamed protein product, partial [Prorocentrum cordatum]